MSVLAAYVSHWFYIYLALTHTHTYTHIFMNGYTLTRKSFRFLLLMYNTLTHTHTLREKCFPMQKNSCNCNSNFIPLIRSCSISWMKQLHSDVAKQCVREKESNGYGKKRTQSTNCAVNVCMNYICARLFHCRFFRLFAFRTGFRGFSSRRNIHFLFSLTEMKDSPMWASTVY